MSLYSYRKLISVLTRVINSSSTVLDSIYSNFPDIYNVLGCIRTTDHMPILALEMYVKESLKEKLLY